MMTKIVFSRLQRPLQFLALLSCGSQLNYAREARGNKMEEAAKLRLEENPPAEPTERQVQYHCSVSGSLTKGMKPCALC